MRYAALAVSLTLACCSPAPIDRPAPTPPPIERPSPAPAPVVQSPDYENFLDAPQTPGNWTYAQAGQRSTAIFRGADGSSPFTLSCDGGRQIMLARQGDANAAVPMRIRTETQDRMLTAQPVQANTPMLAVILQSGDRLLDAMALSRGRFAVETSGLPTLYLPAWAEVTRVIEDCR
jgi:hypothetical protein